MPATADRQRFRNEDLLLGVSPAVNRATWDEGRYEPFIDELCQDREYQKEAIRTALRYLLGGEYGNLRDLAKANLIALPANLLAWLFILAAVSITWAVLKVYKEA